MHAITYKQALSRVLGHQRLNTYLDSRVARESIELVKQLEHGSLHFSVTALVAIETLRSDRINLVYLQAD